MLKYIHIFGDYKMGKASVERPWMKYYQDFDGDISCTKKTLYQYLKETTVGYENFTALNYFGKKYSYFTMFGKIDHLADCFTHLGVKKGEHVVFVTANLPETINSFYALNKIGAIPVVIEPRMAKERIDNFISMVKAKVVIIIDLVYPKIYDLFEKNGVKHVLVQKASYSLHKYQRFFLKLFGHKTKIKYNNVIQRFKDFTKQDVPHCAKEAQFEENATAVVTQTGGTTGSPKGVELTNEALNTIALSFNYTHNDCVPGDIFSSTCAFSLCSFGNTPGYMLALLPLPLRSCLPELSALHILCTALYNSILFHLYRLLTSL